jgi:hypothetical protein
MSIYDEQLAQLRSLLLGKTIKDIVAPNAMEGICKFIMEDGSAFRILATELGWWIEETVARPMDPYPSLTQLFDDYHNTWYLGRGSLDEEAEVEVVDDKLMVCSPSGASYCIALKSLSPWELQVVKDERGRKILARAATLGDCWRTLFSKGYDCPVDLVYEANQ